MCRDQCEEPGLPPPAIKDFTTESKSSSVRSVPLFRAEHGTSSSDDPRWPSLSFAQLDSTHTFCLPSIGGTSWVWQWVSRLRTCTKSGESLNILLQGLLELPARPMQNIWRLSAFRLALMPIVKPIRSTNGGEAVIHPDPRQRRGLFRACLVIRINCRKMNGGPLMSDFLEQHADS